MVNKEFPNALPLGTLLRGTHVDQYELVEVLGDGGFGITYRALDRVLGGEVAIKEYFPIEWAARTRDGYTVTSRTGEEGGHYQDGLQRFLSEARTLARFRNEPNIVRVVSFIEDHGTAYIVMDYVEGQALSQYLKQQVSKQQGLSEDQIKQIIIPILDGLRVVHDADILHQDIKPANIYLRRDGCPVLLDFGGAREVLGEKSRSMSRILTEGYAPYEQYSGKRSQASDLYAIGATLYYCITGETPVASLRRSEALLEGEPDPQPKLWPRYKSQYSVGLLETIDWMLAFRARNRPQCVDDVLSRLLSEDEADDQHPEPATTNKPESQPSGSTTKESKSWLFVSAVVIAVVAVAVYIFLEQQRVQHEELRAAEQLSKQKMAAEQQRKEAVERALEAQREREAAALRAQQEEQLRQQELENKRKLALEAEEEKKRQQIEKLAKERKKRTEDITAVEIFLILKADGIWNIKDREALYKNLIELQGKPSTYWNNAVTGMVSKDFIKHLEQLAQQPESIIGKSKTSKYFLTAKYLKKAQSLGLDLSPPKRVINTIKTCGTSPYIQCNEMAAFTRTQNRTIDSAARSLLKNENVNWQNVRYWQRDLSFYKNHKLIEVEDYSVTPSKQWFFVHGRERALLDFNYKSIVELNKKIPINLNDDNVIEYVKFYFSLVQGRHGRFIIVDRFEDIRWNSIPTLKDKQAMEKLVKPLRIIEKTDKGVFHLKATMFLKDAAFTSDVYVLPDGSIRMGNHANLHENLDVFIHKRY